MTTQKWKLVPVEPDDTMVYAACDASNLFRVDFVRAFEAAIEEAPTPPKLSDERILEIGAMAKAQWNAAADQYNQWRELDSDEITILIARAIEREILGE